MKPTIKHFFDKSTFTLTYVVYDKKTKDAVLLDPVWDYDPAASQLSTDSLKQVLDFLQREELKLHFILETHAHADHVSAAQPLKEQLQVPVGIGQHIQKVQILFKEIFGLPKDFATDGRQFDLLLSEDKTLDAGTLKIQTFHTPGHTPACCCYLIGDALFTGDLLFMPDYGTGRCDFPGGSARDLYQSVQNKVYNLPDSTRTFTGHDYQPGGRELAFESTVGNQKKNNIHLSANTSLEDFVNFRESRDKTLSAPKLLLPSVQMNIDAGHLPPTDEKGRRFLKIPLHQK